jgi:hypothetical protein
MVSGHSKVEWAAIPRDMYDEQLDVTYATRRLTGFVVV